MKIIFVLLFIFLFISTNIICDYSAAYENLRKQMQPEIEKWKATKVEVDLVKDKADKAKRIIEQIKKEIIVLQKLKVVVNDKVNAKHSNKKVVIIKHIEDLIKQFELELQRIVGKNKKIFDELAKKEKFLAENKKEISKYEQLMKDLGSFSQQLLVEKQKVEKLKKDVEKLENEKTTYKKLYDQQLKHVNYHAKKGVEFKKIYDLMTVSRNMFREKFTKEKIERQRALKKKQKFKFKIH